jgi:hypothetical protein
LAFVWLLLWFMDGLYDLHPHLFHVPPPRSYRHSINQTNMENHQMKQIATALVKAQKAFGPALKSSTNPHFKSRYADLSACVEAVIDGLNGAGIALVQRTSEDATGVTVETVFIHESGEMLECGKLHVPAAKQDPQGYGSALTYARRYSLMAACGIAPEDDDGNAGSRPVPKLTEATLKALLADIADCASHDELKNAYFEAIKAVGNDQVAKDKVIAAKDARKAQL